MLSNKGMGYPGEKTPENEEEEIEWKNSASMGYDLTRSYWHVFYEENMPLEIIPPITIDNYDYYTWAFNKLLPGDVIPLHRDVPHPKGTRLARYWMPLQDYTAGHGFIVDGVLVNDYKAGDLFRFREDALHGSFNIGDTPRLTYTFVIAEDAIH